MNNLKLAGAVVVGLVLGFFVFSNRVAGLGAVTVTPGNALDQAVLTTEFQNLANPLGSIVQTTTAAIDFPSTSTSSPQATTSAPGLPAALGDFVVIAPTTSTAGISYSATVVTASTTSATFEIDAKESSGTVAIDPTASLFNITVLPFASFKAPVGL